MTGPSAVRRARPAMGTLVELGAVLPEGADGSAERRLEAAFAGAWKVLEEVEAALSAFDPRSDVGRFNAASAGAELAIGLHAARVLRAARALACETGASFDVTLGTGGDAWALAAGDGATLLRKRSAGVRLDLGGIAKGYAVDLAFHALRRVAGPACWVNAGGDLRVGGVELPVHLRAEGDGGAHPFLRLRDGALATSRYGPGARSALSGLAPGASRHVSVVAPTCLWSDALTKVVALSGRPDHPILSRCGAVAWLHG